MPNHKFIFFNPYQGFGGLEMQMCLRAEDAILDNYDSLLIVSNNPKVINFCKSRELPYQVLEIKHKYLDYCSAIKLGKILKQLACDIIVVGKTESLGYVTFARNHFSKKTAIILYQQMQSGIRKKDIYHNWIYKNLDGAIVLTNKMREALLNNTIIAPQKVRVIPYGIKSERFNPDRYDYLELRRKYNLPDDKLIFGYVARIEPHKAQLDAIEALAKSGLKNVLLVIVGNIDEPEYFDLLMAKTRQYYLDNQVIYIPFVEEVSEIMNCIDVFVMPSRSETFGLVLLEAMASKLPIIAAEGGGVSEIIINEENGLLYTPGKINELAYLMKVLYQDPKLRDRLATNAFEDVKKRFNYYKQSEAFLNFCIKCYLTRKENLGYDSKNIENQ